MAIAALPTHRPLTEDDLAQLPEDGRRYELIDGELLVSPSPGGPHQRVSTNLLLLLARVAPPGYEAFAAPYDWRVNRFNVFVPDLMIVPHEAGESKRLEAPPLLAVEILSPSSRQRDVGLKMRAYEAAGLGWYWIIDPEAPGLTVMQLVDGRFRKVAAVSGEETYRSPAEGPFAVEVTPSRLVLPHNQELPQP